MKPGFKTTEFYLAGLTSLFGAGLSLAGLFGAQPGELQLAQTLGGALLPMLASAAYSLSRGLAKKGK